MTEGYKALTHAAAVIDLSARARIRLTGEDRARLLHALTTNHIQQLLAGHGCYAFFLNANGRILADANVFAFADHLLVDAEPETREAMLSHLDHYIIADDVTVHDDTDRTFALSVEGPQAKDRLGALGIPAPANDWAHEAWGDLTVAHVSATGEPGFRIFGPIERKHGTLELLYLAQATPHDAEVVRIEHARPQYGKDMTASNIVAETGVTEALHFQKGCYLGQEIVERVRSRGRINRRLVSLSLDSPDPPTHGTRLSADGKEVGEITSAAYSPAQKHVVALAYVRVPHDAQGSILEVTGVSAHVR